MTTPPAVLPFRSGLDSLALRIQAALPREVRRGLDRARDIDIRRAVEAVGSPRLPDAETVLLFGNGAMRAELALTQARKGNSAVALSKFSWSASELQRLAAGWDTAREFAPMLAAGTDPTRGLGGRARRSGFGDPAQNGGANGVDRAIRRHPWSMWGQTALAASNGMVVGPPGTPTTGQVTDANSATYTNGSGFDYIITHLTASQNQQPVLMAPNYRVQVSPQYGLPWTGGSRRLDIGTMLTNYSGFQAAPNIDAGSMCRWNFEGASYVLKKSQSIFVTASNLSTAEAVQVTVLLYGTKTNDIGSPRLFADTQLVAAGATQQALNSTNFQNDGDFDCELSELGISSGVGNWGLLQPTVPLVFVRPSDERELMNQITGTMACALNNVPGNLGAYFKLRQPQRLPTGSVINLAIEETTGQAGQIANIGFLGYLEIPV